MTRIIDIADILPTLNTASYSSVFDIVINNTSVLTTAEMIRELEYSYYDMSYISHSDKTYDIAVLLSQWSMYKDRHLDEWTRIFNDVALTQSADFNPMLSYKETRVTEPDLTVESETTYGKVITSDLDTTNEIEHGKTTTGQTNTYDGTLRDSEKSTDSGTDTTTIMGTNTDTASGSDSNTTTTTGTNTETKEGYKDNPLTNLQTDIDFAFKNNLRDLIITGFAKEILFYDNGNHNEEGYRYGF